VKTRLLASSSSTDEIIKLISRYWCTDASRITLTSSDNLNYEVIQGEKIMTEFRVIFKKKRYRFELLKRGEK
jgi:hypothetical protein